jgi:hypothetical protein
MVNKSLFLRNVGKLQSPLWELQIQLMFHIRRLPVSNLVLETSYSHWNYSLSSSVAPDIPEYCLKLCEGRFLLHPFNSVFIIQPFGHYINWTSEGVPKWSKNEQIIYDKYRSLKAGHVTSELKRKTRISLSLLMCVFFLQLLSCVEGRRNLSAIKSSETRRADAVVCIDRLWDLPPRITADLACSLGQYGDYQIKRLSLNFLC